MHFEQVDEGGERKVHVHMEYPAAKPGKKMYYAIDDDHIAQGGRRLQDTYDSMNSTCAQAECLAGEPGMFVEHAPEDVPPVGGYYVFHVQ